MKEIQSAKNPRIKELKKLHKKKYREEKGEYLLEGFHLIEEAVASNAKVNELFITQRGLTGGLVGLKKIRRFLLH